LESNIKLFRRGILLLTSFLSPQYRSPARRSLPDGSERLLVPPLSLKPSIEQRRHHNNARTFGAHQQQKQQPEVKRPRVKSNQQDNGKEKSAQPP
jgi:hypothetical protein